MLRRLLLQARDARHLRSGREVGHADDLVARDLGQRLLAQAAHDLGHALGAGLARELRVHRTVEVVAVLLVQLLHGLVEVHALLGVVGGHLDAHLDGDDGVLVAGVGADEVAVGLLEAHEVAVLLALVLELVDLVADVLEAGQHAAHLKAVVAGQRVGHHGRDDRGDGDLGLGVLAALLGHLDEPVHQQDAHLVAGQQHVLAVVRDGGAHAVGIGVGGDHEVGLDLVGQLQRQLEGLAELGVGVLAGREVAVRVLLLGHDLDVVDADLLEDTGHALHARAVERGVDDLVALRRLEAGDGDLLHVLDEGVQDLLRRPLDQALLQAFLKAHHLGAAEDRRLGDGGRDLVGGLVGDLAAVVVVDLVAVVLRRVVGGGQHDARGGVQVAHREGQRGHRLDARVHVDVDAVGGQHAGGHLLEVLALETAVARERQRRVVVVGVEVVGHALRRLGDDVDVHTVGADAQRAAQARRAEFQITIKSVVKLLLLAGGHQLVELGLEVRVLDVCGPQLYLGSDFFVHTNPFRSCRRALWRRARNVHTVCHTTPPAATVRARRGKRQVPSAACAPPAECTCAAPTRSVPPSFPYVRYFRACAVPQPPDPLHLVRQTGARDPRRTGARSPRAGAHEKRYPWTSSRHARRDSSRFWPTNCGPSTSARSVPCTAR